MAGDSITFSDAYGAGIVDAGPQRRRNGNSDTIERVAICGPRLMAVVSRYERPFAVASVVVVVAAVIIFHFR